METLSIVGLVLAALCIVATGLPLLPVTWWWVQALDFPRTQLFYVGVGAAAALAADMHFEPWRIGVSAALVAALVYQGARILPYTRLWRRPVKAATGEGPRLKLLISNVLMTNRESARLLDLVGRLEPDLVVLAEPDAWWEDEFRSIERAYPHVMRYAKPDTYGLLLYSRHPLGDPRTEFLVEPDLPSFHAHIELGGRRVLLHFLHPKPPAPGESTSTTDRDGEILIVGRRVHDEPDEPTVVAGDLNDVAWSDTTRLFQKTSGLLDPRRGRGMFSTFHAGYPFLRWPLDHVFHSEHFTLARMMRLPNVGSDHFPIFVELELTPGADAVQEPLRADADDHAEAAEKIANAGAG